MGTTDINPAQDISPSQTSPQVSPPSKPADEFQEKPQANEKPQVHEKPIAQPKSRKPAIFATIGIVSGVLTIAGIATTIILINKNIENEEDRKSPSILGLTEGTTTNWSIVLYGRLKEFLEISENGLQVSDQR